MLQEYSSTQNDFRRLMPSVQAVSESSSHPGHPPVQISAQFGRPVDPIQHQFLLNTMQTQIESFNALRELGRKFLDTSPSSSLNTSTTAK